MRKAQVDGAQELRLAWRLCDTSGCPMLLTLRGETGVVRLRSSTETVAQVSTQIHQHFAVSVIINISACAHTRLSLSPFLKSIRI